MFPLSPPVAELWTTISVSAAPGDECVCLKSLFREFSPTWGGFRAWKTIFRQQTLCFYYIHASIDVHESKTSSLSWAHSKQGGLPTTTSNYRFFPSPFYAHENLIFLPFGETLASHISMTFFHSASTMLHIFFNIISSDEFLTDCSRFRRSRLVH